MKIRMLLHVVGAPALALCLALGPSSCQKNDEIGPPVDADLDASEAPDASVDSAVSPDGAVDAAVDAPTAQDV